MTLLATEPSARPSGVLIPYLSPKDDPMSPYDRNPYDTFHTGAVIRVRLQELGWTRADLAAKTAGVPAGELDLYVEGRTVLLVHHRTILGRVLGMPESKLESWPLPPPPGLLDAAHDRLAELRRLTERHLP
jgi:hypothetical protein